MSGLVGASEAQTPTAAEVREGLDRVRVVLEREIRSEIEPVQALCDRLESYQGKMLRPTMTLLAGLACDEESGGERGLTDTHVTIAAVTELVHLATLVHDDVLDEADTRRKAATINHLCGNEVAVILGDYLISEAFHLCSGLGSQHASQRIGRTTNRVCEGELLQLHHRNNLDLDEATYFTIIERKTASLIGVAAELGAWASGAGEATQELLYGFGRRLGAAFQIRDDLLDLFGEERVVGKSLGKDIEKGKLTLPLIHHLASAAPADREAMRERLGGGGEGGGGDAAGARGDVRAALERTGSIAYAQERAQGLVAEAREGLAGLAPSRARDALAEMADAVLTRQW